jgi:SPW repeat
MLARIIPTGFHAVMDYAVGLLLIASPWLFGFADESNAAQWIAILSGIALIGLSALTDYEGGFLRRAIAMRTHLMTDAALGVFLVASPWLFGFADEGTNAWLPFVAIGLGELGAAAMTDPDPHEGRARRRTAQTAS